MGLGEEAMRLDQQAEVGSGVVEEGVGLGGGGVESGFAPRGVERLQGARQRAEGEVGGGEPGGGLAGGGRQREQEIGDGGGALFVGGRTPADEDGGVEPGVVERDFRGGAGEDERAGEEEA